MEIRYKDTKSFKTEDLERLFLSINRESGRYPENLPEQWKIRLMLFPHGMATSL